MSRAFQYGEYLFLRSMCALIRLVPFQFGMSCSRGVGRILFWALSGRRQIALDNLRAAFSDEKSEQEIQTIARKSFENLGAFAFEFVWIPKMAKNVRHYVESAGLEAVNQALSQKKGVVLLVPHLGNWEWMAVVTAFDGFPMHAVARPLKNPFVYRYIKRMRGLTGLEVVNKKGAARDSLRLLKRNQVVAILIDQHERQGAVRVPFFGRDAFTTTLPAILAIKRGAAVVPCFFYRSRDLPCRMVYCEALPVIETGDYEQDLRENTKQYVAAIEREIRKQPSDWLWMHRRWREPIQ
jgi:Kdo2-lipid IVA lauroyltransferase/acyltransferase